MRRCRHYLYALPRNAVLVRVYVSCRDFARVGVILKLLSRLPQGPSAMFLPFTLTHTGQE